MFLGVIIVLVAVVIAVAWPMLAKPTTLEEMVKSAQNLLLVVGGLTIAGMLCDVIGRLKCLAMPEGLLSATRPLGYVSVILSLVATAITVASVAGPLSGSFVVPDYIVQVGNLIGLVGAVLFVVFLRSLALEVNAKAQAATATSVLVLGVVIVVVMVAMVGMAAMASQAVAAGNQQAGQGAGSLALIFACMTPLLGLVLLILYLVLLGGLKAKVLDYAAGGETPRVLREDDRDR